MVRWRQCRRAVQQFVEPERSRSLCLNLVRMNSTVCCYSPRRLNCGVDYFLNISTAEWLRKDEAHSKNITCDSRTVRCSGRVLSALPKSGTATDINRSRCGGLDGNNVAVAGNYTYARIEAIGQNIPGNPGVCR